MILITCEECLHKVVCPNCNNFNDVLNVKNYCEHFADKSALEKQIPKKPKVLKVHDISGYKYGDCFCGEHIMDDEKYCSNCGQKLLWESDAE